MFSYDKSRSQSRRSSTSSQHDTYGSNTFTVLSKPKTPNQPTSLSAIQISTDPLEVVHRASSTGLATKPMIDNFTQLVQGCFIVCSNC